MGKTNIEITEGTRRDLRVWKAERDLTYDEAIDHLLTAYKYSNQPTEAEVVEPANEGNNE